MPRMAKQVERIQCIPLQSIKFKIANSGVNKNRTYFDFEKYKSFVDVKEVPYGRYNSDSDYRGS